MISGKKMNTIKYQSDFEIIEKDGKAWFNVIKIEGDTIEDIIDQIAKKYGDGVYLVRFTNDKGRKTTRRFRLEGLQPILLNLPQKLDRKKEDIVINPKQVETINNNTNTSTNSLESLINKLVDTVNDATEKAIKREQEVTDRILAFIETKKEPSDYKESIRDYYDFVRELREDALAELPEKNMLSGLDANSVAQIIGSIAPLFTNRQQQFVENPHTQNEINELKKTVSDLAKSMKVLSDTVIAKAV